MIDVRRFKPFCQIALALVAVATALNVALAVLSNTPVLGWLPTTMAGVGYLEDSRSRVDAAIKEHRTGDARDYRLAAVVGISNVRQGVELSVVAQAAGPKWRFIGLAGAGLGVDDVEPYAKLLLASELRPEVVVLGLGLYQLVDSRPRRGSVNVSMLEYFRRGDLRNAATELRNSVWVYYRRQDINVVVQGGLLNLRSRLFNQFGVQLSESEAAQRTPWREMMRSDWPDHFSQATLREEEQFFADLGMFERATYENSPKAMATFVQLVRQFRDKRANVILVLMPEHSTMQRRIPVEAWDIVQAQLKAAFPDEPPPALDFRKAIGDTGFVDLAHLNRRGSAEFSRQLATALREIWPTHSRRGPGERAN
jgi:hypothetical protein